MAKTTLNKYIALILCVSLIICSIPFSASAKEYKLKLNLSTYLDASFNIEQPMLVYDEDKALAESINTQFKDFKEDVDISAFKIRNTEANQQRIVEILSYGLPECFHLNTSFYVGFDYSGNYITNIYPQYDYEKSEYITMLDECNAVADKLLRGIEGNTKLNDVQKLLLLHDRIALNCEYDYERYSQTEDVPVISHTMYGAFVNKIAVCQGYTLGYGYLLDRIGIRNYYCASSRLNHIWNIVYVNNKPYHVDITWDDTVWDVTGEVLHDNFLISSEELYQTGHRADDYDTSPVDTTYDNYFWKNSKTAFTLVNDEIYYIDDSEANFVNIKRYSDKNTIYKTEHYWMDGSDSYWPDNYARLATDGKNLLFSLSEGIYKLDINSKMAVEIHKPELTGNFKIFGFTYENGNLIYDLFTKPDFEKDTKRKYQRTVPYITAHTPGDVNDSNTIDLLDVVVLARAVADWQVYYNSSALDVNGDGVKTLADVTYLARYVAGWSGITLH